MEESSTTLLQKLDCNCNDCFFMTRNLTKYNEALEAKKKSDLMCFNSKKASLLVQAKEVLEAGERAEKYGKKVGAVEKAKKKADSLTKEAASMKFQFDNKLAVHFGNCSKLNKPVRFTPNLMQLDTQDCFEHRKDYKPNSVIAP
jgi:hypothetical protein